MNEAVEPSSGQRVPLRAIVLLAAAAFASSINLRVCDPLLPQMASDFRVTVGEASVVVAGFTIGYGLLQLLFGPVGDLLGKYRIAALASIATGLATALASLSATLDHLMLARFVAGAFAAAPIPLAFAWIGDAVPYERRQAVLARFLSAQISGIILGQAAGGILGDAFGWRTVFVFVGACHMLAGAAMLVELATNPADQPAGAVRRRGLGDMLAAMLELLARPWVRVMLISVGVEGFAFYGAFAYIGADLHHRFHLGFTLVGLMMATFGVGAITYSLSARRLLEAIGERGLALAGGITASAGYLALAVAPVVTIVPLIMVALGLGFYMIHNTLQANATQMAPEARGLGVSLFAFALFIGQSLGVAVFAPVVDHWHAPAIYVVAAIILPAIAIWFRHRLLTRPSA